MFRYKLQIIHQTFFKTTKFNMLELVLSDATFKDNLIKLSEKIVPPTRITPALDQWYWLKDYHFDKYTQSHKLQFNVLFHDDVDKLGEKIASVLSQTELVIKEIKE